jgi:hypothetical protein
MSEPKNDRRTFILKACAAMAGVVAAPAIIGAVVDAGAQEMGHGMMMGAGGSAGYIMNASIKQRCGTCEFWGGPRCVSLDRKALTITGLGWCNNSASPNYRKVTSPDHGPMDTWSKWSVLA